MRGSSSGTVSPSPLSTSSWTSSRGGGVDAVDAAAGCPCPGRGAPTRPMRRPAGRQPQLGLGGGAVGVRVAGRHQRAPVPVGDHPVDRRRSEVVAVTDGLLAPAAVVDHARPPSRPTGGRGPRGRARCGGPGCAASTPRGRRWPARSSATRRARPARHAGQPLGPVQVEHVDGGERRRQPVGVVEQVVRHGPDVDPVAERRVEALVVPVVVGGRRRPAACGSPTSGTPSRGAGVSSTWWTAAISPLTDRHSARPSTSTVVTRSTGGPVGRDVQRLAGHLGHQHGHRARAACRGRRARSCDGAACGRRPRSGPGARPARVAGVLAQGRAACHEGVVGQVEGAGRVCRRRRPGRRGRSGSRPARPAARSRPAAGRWAPRTRPGGGASGRSRRPGRPPPAGRRAGAGRGAPTPRCGRRSRSTRRGRRTPARQAGRRRPERRSAGPRRAARGAATVLGSPARGRPGAGRARRPPACPAQSRVICRRRNGPR